MPTIYRRARGLSPPPDECHPSRLRVAPDDLEDDAVAAPRRRWWRRLKRRDGLAVALATQRVSRTLWLAALVYAFWGLPALGRLLAGVRYAHRFHLPALLAGLAAGALQDAAVFLQASTALYFVKLLLDPPSPTAGADAAAVQRRFPNSGFMRNHLSPYARLPVYRPVLANEYDQAAEPVAGQPAPVAGISGRNHLTLVAASPFTSPLAIARRSRSRAARFGVFGGSLGRVPAPPAAPSESTSFCTSLSRVCRRVVVATLLLAIVVVSTVASVADFCLQVALHPRLDRARVNIFLSYASQFIAAFIERASLTNSSSDPSILDEVDTSGYDDGDLPRSVVFSWGIWGALVLLLTYGFFTGKLPLLPDVLHLPAKLVCCDRFGFCCWRRDDIAARKNSLPLSLNEVEDIALTTPAPQRRLCESPQWMQRCWSALKWFGACVWLSDTRPSRLRRRSGGSISIPNNLIAGNSSTATAASMSISWPTASTTASAPVAYAFSGGSGSSSSPTIVQKPVATLWRGVLMTLLTTMMALTTAITLDLHAGLDMPLMANALFALETENLVARATGGTASLTVRHVVNCTLASETLLGALGHGEEYSLGGIGNDDRCSLLWRETTTFRGDRIVELPNLGLLETKYEDTSSIADKKSGDTNSSVLTASPLVNASDPPNIIVIHMASWRHLDVGVLGGQTKKKKVASGRGITPQFDALAASGVLFTSHYTPCVQSSPCTLLTTLFGMQPPCADPTESPFGSLKRFVGTSTTTGVSAPSVEVRGLPQFLKQRGYQNVFWRATDLARDHEDEFLTLNGFDKLVDDRKVRQLLRDARVDGDVKTPTLDDDDHVGAGIHDHLSFEMLLYAIEEAYNASLMTPTTNELASNSSEDNLVKSNDTSSAIKMVNTTAGTDISTMIVSAPTTVVESNASDAVVLNVSAVKGRHYHPVTNATVSNEDLGVNISAISNANVTTDETETPATVAPPSMTAGLRAPFFIDMYTISSNSPYRVPRFFTSALNELKGQTTRFNRKYLEAMHFSDAMLGEFVADLREKGLMNNTIVIIAGDHGDGKLEHVTNPSARDSSVYDEVARVPFLLLADDFLSENDKGRRVDQLTSQMDLMATIADLLGVSPEHPLLQHGVGRSMLRTRAAQNQSAIESATEEPLAGPARWIDDVRGALLPGKDRSGEKRAEMDGNGVATNFANDGEGLHGRRVLLCNPFHGGTKGVRTARDELKYVFFADRSFNVFDENLDPHERIPVRRGFDLDDMDADVRAQYNYANEQLDLHAFLFEANKFVGEQMEAEDLEPVEVGVSSSVERSANESMSNLPTPGVQTDKEATKLRGGKNAAAAQDKEGA